MLTAKIRGLLFCELQQTDELNLDISYKDCKELIEMASQGTDGGSKKPRNYYVDYTKRNYSKFGNKRHNSSEKTSKYGKTPDIAFGHRGFFITSVDEVKAYLETRNVLEDYYEQIYKSKSEQKKDNVEDADGDKKEMTTEDEVELELKKLRFDRPFKQVKTHCRNTIFIKVVDDFQHVDPTVIVDKFFDDLIEKRETRTSNTIKLLPVLDTCRNSVACVKQSVADLLSSVLKDELDAKKYFIEIQSRGNYKLSSDDKQRMIEGVAEIVTESRPEWKVDRESADYLIVLNILKEVCCVSFLKSYWLRAKYNIATLLEPPKLQSSEDTPVPKEES